MFSWTKHLTLDFVYIPLGLLYFLIILKSQKTASPPPLHISSLVFNHITQKEMSKIMLISFYIPRLFQLSNTLTHTTHILFSILPLPFPLIPAVQVFLCQAHNSLQIESLKFHLRLLSHIPYLLFHLRM